MDEKALQDMISELDQLDWEFEKFCEECDKREAEIWKAIEEEKKAETDPNQKKSEQEPDQDKV